MVAAAPRIRRTRLVDGLPRSAPCEWLRRRRRGTGPPTRGAPRPGPRAPGCWRPSPRCRPRSAPSPGRNALDGLRGLLGVGGLLHRGRGNLGDLRRRLVGGLDDLLQRFAGLGAQAARLPPPAASTPGSARKSRGRPGWSARPACGPRRPRRRIPCRARRPGRPRWPRSGPAGSSGWRSPRSPG